MNEFSAIHHLVLVELDSSRGNRNIVRSRRWSLLQDALIAQPTALVGWCAS
jgi:hypothetical protein